jgi:hypothetical protein
MCSRHDPLWTTADVAAFLSVPVQTIYDWRTRGYGPTGFSAWQTPSISRVGHVRLAGPDDSAGGLAMPRRRLSPGEWGEVSVSRSPGGPQYRERAWFRDFDGVRRMVERDARTDWAARTALETALAQRARRGVGSLRGPDTFRGRGGRVAGAGGAVGEAGAAVAGNSGDILAAAERARVAGSWRAATPEGHDAAGGSVCDRRA